MRAVGYIRVSSEEQASEGVSLDAQRAKVQGYAELYGLELVSIEVDAGVSAKTIDRPALARALALLDRDEADGLVIAKLRVPPTFQRKYALRTVRILATEVE